MQLVTAALAAAVLTALAYTVLTERATYASVRRRQLDAWAALVALLCLVFLVSGGHDVQREYDRRMALAQPAATPVIAIGRRAPVSLMTPLADTVARPGRAQTAPEPKREPADPVVLPDAAVPMAEAAGAPDRPAEASPFEIVHSGEPALSAAGSAPEIVAVRTAWPADATAVLRSPTAVRRNLVGDTPPLIVPTLRVPTAPPNMPLPLPPATPTATATPECGSPDDIELALTIQDARADRSDGELVVRYRVEVGNGAGFPVTLANVNVTALNSAGGSETYGHATRPDMTVGAGASVTIEGGLRLDRSPGPFGRTELCISLSAETCGRRSRYEAFRRCSTVNGF